MRTLLAGIFTLLMTSTVYADVVTFSEGWARESIPGAENGAAYGKLANPSQKALIIKGVSGSVADKIEVHTHVMTDGMMSMQQVKALELPPNEQITFEPGSYHFMLFGLSSPLKSGQSFDLQLHFTNGETQQISIRVK
ncbi:copper chaperone PCu(A)C [Idiomarina sp. X4]|uniref:copper chaperone PCu(A)C n=1 Tax=Idiomarina sp. X4 TaxID=2055892 RepID=UPI0012FD22FD|nr:copper chaperone PCu(A)C [Idiomarina sp. X4]